MNRFIRTSSLAFTSLFFFSLCLLTACGSRGPANKTVTAVDAGTYVFQAQDGRRLRVRAYGENMIRLQTVRQGEAFYPDDHYEMVQSHDMPRKLTLDETDSHYLLSTGSAVSVLVDKQSLAATLQHDNVPLLKEKQGVTWQGNTIKVAFDYDNEHFTGLGHGYFAREDSIDLRGKTIQRNYGSVPIEQAPLIVPFYLASKGYGVFLNSTFPNTFTFGVDGEYSIAIDDHGFGGRMDYFFIAGRDFKSVLQRYVTLTGQPRLPPLSMFGLQLSDKGHDHNSPTPSDVHWWQKKIGEHRAAGFPLDHVVNDNRWRAAGGQRCISKFDWDPERYPDPKAYGQWLQENGLTMTVDFNRCIAKNSEGWQASFNVPETGTIEFEDSAPDLTNAEFRAWFWQLFYNKVLNPALEFPGEALWIDEFDEQGNAPKTMMLSNGRSSAEMRNYWFFLIAKALVAEGWDKSDLNSRPYVWVRGMTAGAQRYATLWSGDIYPHYEDMKKQIRGMQLAGMSGFPYWGHDAGGFHNWDTGEGPNDELYVQWAMALGSVSPIWKPHGMGQSRWPLDRSTQVQEHARKFMQLRYELMPYLYSLAMIAHETGTPMVRPMVLEFPEAEEAWQRDLQFMLGDKILVAPNTTGTEKVALWLPTGNWYDYHSKQLIQGDRVLTVAAPIGTLPMFVKAGAVIPRREAAVSTAFIKREKLIFDIYSGGNYANAEVIEDDGISEAYRDGDYAVTRASFDNQKGLVQIKTTRESAAYMPEQREYDIYFYGSERFNCLNLDGASVATESFGSGVKVHVPARPVGTQVDIAACDSETETP